MRTRTTTAAIALLLATLTGCSSSEQPKTQDEIAARCAPALKARPEGDTSKPKECEGLTTDNYDLLVVSSAVDELGWIDDNGNVDMDKLLQDTKQ
ncbi:hypothetical protein [Streptomyces sp. C8S0]|uniref:hypothetical protein n=1 Tax=Streptomyces sp. C8S0 TaxID=2585716 RepID=UPI00125E5B53|nr:hypothetical protein [Streptomyces sp. C8S0]